MPITSKHDTVILHFKEDELVAITVMNGAPKLYKAQPMTNGDALHFFGADTPPAKAK